MKIDLAKRRRVMERSRFLGHCICDPKRACPCDVFTNHGICPCAGERPDPVDVSQVKLTKLVRNAGCASKIPPAELDAVLSRLPSVTDPNVICGMAAGDDAAIYRIADGLHLVQTVDVFTPCVDDPHAFGRICAANCLSDVYAMGGVPRTALSIVAFPSDTLSAEVLFRMLEGAMKTLAEAGVALVGGHSVKDEEIKLGFAITGLIDPAVAAALEHPQPGDLLVLTKPLGTGVLAFAEQIGRGNPDALAASEASMATLNRAAAEAMIEAGASACTDVTGFGLFGHLIRLMRQHRLTARVFAESLPSLPGAVEALRDGIIPGAIERNREYVGEDMTVSDGVDEALIHLGFDAQTSGGLLIAVPEARLERLLQAFAAKGVTGFVIGRIDGQSYGQIILEKAPTAALNLPGRADTGVPAATTPQLVGESHAGCCADVFGPAAAAEAQASALAESQRAFAALMRSVAAPGALSEKTKELILFSLVLQSRCGPCFDAHYKAAQEMGITRDELDEAAWCAIAMGGAPVKMFYAESLARLRDEAKKSCCT
ncbi:MAG TPA: selenide, water dikinase SelD [Verrucomicrobiota bacterium]|nr:selenide, water dikinase SelD [Verrucomicrobiota bacterium]